MPVVAEGYSPCPGVGNMQCIFLAVSTVSLYRMNSHYGKDWITCLFCELNSCQSTGTQEVMNKMQRKKGGWVYFLYCHKALNPASVLPLTVHVCMSPEVGRIFSSSLQKLMMFLPCDSSSVLCFSWKELQTPFTLIRVVWNHAAKQSSGLSLLRCMHGSYFCSIPRLCSQHQSYLVM